MQDTLDRLVLDGLIQETKVIGDLGIVEYRYALTEKGRMLLKIISLPSSEEAKIKNLLEKYKDKSTKEIVNEVYEYAGLK